MAVTEEKMKFEDLLQNTTAIDSKDRVKRLGECIDFEFDELMGKINEYNQDGSITIKIQFKIDKKSKNGIEVISDVTKKAPRGLPRNQLYLDKKTNGLFFDDPEQTKLFPVREIHAKGAKKEGE